MVDSFHSSGNSSLFQREIISLWISQRKVVPLALITLLGFDQYLVIYIFLASQEPSQPQRPSSHALVSQVCVFLSA